LAAGKNIQLVHGIELSTHWENTGIHVLGLDFDPDSQDIRQAAEVQTGARQTRALQIAERLEKQGISNALEGAATYAPTSYLGRPHFAQHIVASGKARNIQTAFQLYLGSGKAGDVKHHWADLPQVVEWIRAARGIPVLAHPLKYSLTRSKLKRLLQAFKALGGQGMEVVSGQQTPDQTRSMSALCKEMGLLASCGSDFHSPETRWAELGRFPALPAGLKPVWECFR
ncbi:MAG TPA: PHP domain-containing protein, partial [Xanthomonadales bacterium]|nr:PHP domain-containing protein [Xanthomonadales bacterium]